MGAITELKELHAQLVTVDPEKAKEVFTNLFSRGCDLLGLNDREAALTFDTSTPTVSRWRRGVVVPLVAGLVLRFMREEIETRIKLTENATPDD